ncbi:MAG: hypothetical protein LH679_21210, partial [Cyanobacteria bacterium CAN_BIN43]|nr:hypothetical protein [Cyanobacteria bacterium CAN_BIN43]
DSYTRPPTPILGDFQTSPPSKSLRMGDLGGGSDGNLYFSDNLLDWRSFPCMVFPWHNFTQV